MQRNTLELAVQSHHLDLDAMVLSGFSQGASQSWQIALEQPERFRGFVAVAGGGYDPELLGDRKTTPRIVLMVGADDTGAHQAGIAAQRSLGEKRIKHRFEVFKGVGHTYPHNPVRYLVKAFAWVLGQPSPLAFKVQAEEPGWIGTKQGTVPVRIALIAFRAQ